MRSSRGDWIRATSEVENSISMIDTSPSSPSKDLENGSVSYRRMPFLVAVAAG